MDLGDCLRTDCVSLGFRAEGKDAVLRHIAALAVRHPACSVAEAQVYEALRQRERKVSTGFEHGIAIPHARLEGLTGFIVGLVTLSDGVDFKAADRQPTRLAVFILGPPDRPGDHVRLLSAVSRALASQAVRDGLVAAADPAAAIALLAPRIPLPDGAPAGPGHSLVTVSVQIEKAFLDILQAVASETGDISVVKASDASEFLHRLPLYAVLWDDEPLSFHRVIAAVVERQAVPRLTAAIAQIADALHSEGGVLVAVQDLAYCRGALRAVAG